MSGSTNPNSSMTSSMPSTAASSSSFYSTSAPSITTATTTTTTTTGYNTGAANSGLVSDKAVAIQSGTDVIQTTTAAGSTTTTGLQNVAVVPDAALTRTEERVLVEQYEVPVAVANKYVITERVRNTVPTMKEKAVLERESIPESEKAALTAEIREEHREMPLMQDRVVATKETVPVETVKLSTEVERVDVTTDKELSSYVTTEGVNVGSKTLDNSLITEQTRTTAMPVTNSSATTTTTTTVPITSNTITTTIPVTSNVTTTTMPVTSNTTKTTGTIRNM